MYKIGLSIAGKEFDEGLFIAYKEAGIEAMELSCRKYGYGVLDFNAIRALADKYEIDLWSMHLPFLPFAEIDPSQTATKDNAVKFFSELIKKGGDIGINKFVVHPSGERIAPEDRPGRMENAKETFYKLAEVAAEYDAYIAVEDLPRLCLGNCSSEIAEIVSAHDRLRVCFDTNHLLNEDPVEFIHKLGDKIITLHVSDYDFVNERHWLPGEGDIDWPAVIQALKDVNYNGAWLYEIRFTTPKSIIRERDLTCEDFVRNAKELFEGKTPTTFCERIPDLPMFI